MSALLRIAEKIHSRALQVAGNFKTAEVELLEVLGEVDDHRVYTVMGYNSLFMYATGGLKLSEEVACIYINVARKMQEVPALKTEIACGAITVSKAKRLCSVLNISNHGHWLEVAKNSSKRELERLVAAESPRAAVVEKSVYVSADRLQLQLGVSESLMRNIRRLQDMLSQRYQKPVSIEDVLNEISEEYLQRHDPLLKAERALQKEKEKEICAPKELKAKSDPESCPGTIRKPLSALIRHKVNVKYGGRCAHIDADGNRCASRRHLHVHHIIPLSEGGTNDLSNLELLCSGHHRAVHLQKEAEISPN